MTLNPYVKKIIECVLGCMLFLAALRFPEFFILPALVLAGGAVTLHLAGVPFRFTMYDEKRVYRRFRRIK